MLQVLKTYHNHTLWILGVWGIGLGSEKADLNSVPMGNDAESWVLCSDGYLRHNKEEMHRITQLPQEGDTIVCSNHL